MFNHIYREGIFDENKIRYKLLAIAISLFIADFGLTWYFLNYTSYVE